MSTRNGLRPRGLVDVHSHVVPSLDDGARSVEEGLDLCRLAFEAGTQVLFATPHAHAPWDSYPWTLERRRVYEEALALMRPAVAEWGLDLRRGLEVFPTELPGALDPKDVRLEGTDGILIEFPGSWLTRFEAPLEAVERAGEVVEAAGLIPILAHPERCTAACASPDELAAFVDRGWLLCVNADSLLGGNGSVAAAVAWELIEGGQVALAASDGHRQLRPPTLDRAYEVVVRRCGAGRARDLFGAAVLLGARAG